MSEKERIVVEFTNDLRIKWDWNDLLQDATAAEENINLAVAGLVLSRDAEFARRKVERVLQLLGFDRLKSDCYQLSTVTRNDVSEPARTFGHRLIEKDGKQYHVICAVFKGTTTIPDVITDIESVHDGFYNGGLNCALSLAEYVKGIEGLTKDNTIMFITGHSLGASTANVVGRLCGGLANEEAKFVYTFASPNYETEGEAYNGRSYPNFRYYTNEHDVVPKVPLNILPHCFSKIGSEHLFNYETLSESQRQRFRRLYEYFRGISFENDTELTGLGLKEKENVSFKVLKNHLAHTYMSFILSELPDDEIDKYLNI